MRLFQLPNGTWIDPKYILAVEAVDEEDCDITNTHYNPRVIIHLRGDRRVIERATFQMACELRDLIASKT